MYITTYSDLYPNLSFAPDVTDTMRDIITDVYHDYFASNPRFQREILIIPSHERVYPDRVGCLYANFGFLFYDPAAENRLMAFAMFSWIDMIGDSELYHQNVYSHSVSFEVIIYASLRVAPPDCMLKFSDIPLFGAIGNISIRSDQLGIIRLMARQYYGKLDYRGHPKHTLEWGRDFLLTHLPPCKLEHLLGANTTLRYTQNVSDIWKPRIKRRLEQHIMSQLVLFGHIDKHFEFNVPIWTERSIDFAVTIEEIDNVGTVVTMTPTYDRTAIKIKRRNAEKDQKKMDKSRLAIQGKKQNSKNIDGKATKKSNRKNDKKTRARK